MGRVRPHVFERCALSPNLVRSGKKGIALAARRGLAALTAFVLVVPAGVAQAQAIPPVPPPSASVPAQAAGGEGTVGTYQQVIRDALTEYEAGNWAEARALFEQAHTLRPSARTLRGLGMASFELRNYVRAESELSAALQDSRQPLTTAQRTELTAILQRIARYVGKLTIKVEPPEATVLLDGAPLSKTELDLDLGQHEISVSAPGHHSLNRNVMIEGGKHQTLELVLIPLDIKATDAARSASAASATEAPPPSEAVETESVPSTAISADYTLEPRSDGSVFETWWFWTAVGVVAAGGIVTAVVVANGSEDEPLLAGDNGQVIQVLTLSR